MTHGRIRWSPTNVLRPAMLWKLNAAYENSQAVLCCMLQRHMLNVQDNEQRCAVKPWVMANAWRLTELWCPPVNLRCRHGWVRLW